MKKISDFPYISSRSNAKITEAAKLSDKKYRDATGKFAFEGIKLLCDACGSGFYPETVFITENAAEKFCDEIDKCKIEEKITVVSDSVYEKLSFENSPQGIFCIAPYLSFAKEPAENETVIFLDNIGDPGNLGAILRSADAFGVGKIYISKGSADLFSPKAIRACMGAAFRVNTETECDISAKIAEFRKSGRKIYAAMLDESAMTLCEAAKISGAGFVIGNEGHGVSAAVRAACDGAVYIPMREGGVQSLNAAVAAGIIIWEACGRK